MTGTQALQEADQAGARGSPQTEMPSSKGKGESPSAWQLVFASLFTPTWNLSLLLFVCLFLPSYEGCNGETVYVADAVITRISDDAIYPRFLVVWPYLFGLIVTLGTISIARSGRPERARRLWWSLAGLVGVHSVLLVVVLTTEPPTSWSEWSTWDWETILWAAYWLGTTVILIALIPITGIFCRTWFNAAIWLQLALAVTAAICLSYFIPAIVFAKKFLIGGRVAVACSVLLIVSTILERLDGHRALVRNRGESPVRLSLRSILLLMLVGGLVCAWAGTYLFLELDFLSVEN